MSNITTKEAQALLKKAGSTIRYLVKENSDKKAELAQLRRHQQIEKIARDMEVKGLSPDLSFDEKLAALARADNLSVTEQAVKLATPQGLKLGKVSDHPGTDVSAFETFITTGEDAGE